MPDSIAHDRFTQTVIEAPAPFSSPGDAVTNLTSASFHRHASTAEIALWRLNDVLLDLKLGLVFQDGQVIGPMRVVAADAGSAAVEACLQPAGQALSGQPVFCGFNRYCANYFHILTEILPSIAAYATSPDFRDGLILLGAPLPVLGRALVLARIRMPKVMVVKPYMPPVAVETLIFSTLLTGLDAPSRFCQSLYRRMAALAEPSLAGHPRQIYIARTDATARPMRNEDALIAMLQRYGVEPVVLSKMTLDDQIVLFRDATLIIGPHGAGLANIVFSQPGTILYELLPEHMQRSCMNLLAQQSGLHYWCDVHPSDTHTGAGPHETAWSVDLALTERRLRQIQAKY